ncbi:hypothetical protein BC361_31090 [Ensifer sp. LC54]|nr:hypothetical protein BC361_31090 [Ensifer sp. LC54]OCP19501.1 hypothetical protein BC363_31035 [Ensifer sp. LC384]
MTNYFIYESVARDLAAVLSPRGEADWRQYLGLARAVEKSLERQFDEVFPPPRHLLPRSRPGWRPQIDQAERSRRGTSRKN